MTAALVQPRLRPGGAPGMPDCLIADAGHSAPVVLAIPGNAQDSACMAGSLAAHPAFADATIIVPLPGPSWPGGGNPHKVAFPITILRLNP